MPWIEARIQAVMNGLAREFAERNQLYIGKVLLTALGGILLGLFVLLIFRLPVKFTYYLIAGPVILFIAIMTGRFKRFFQGMLIFIIPFNYHTHFFRRPGFYGTTGLAFSPLDVILIVLYAIWLYELLIRRNRSLRFFPKITVPALSLVGMSALSMIVAQDPSLTLFETIQFFKAVLLYLYVANHIQNKRDISFVLVLLLGGLFLQSLIGFAQKWLGMSVDLRLFSEFQEIPSVTLEGSGLTLRVIGSIGGHNSFAKYLEQLIPLSLALLFTELRLKHKLASGVVFICGLIALVLTLSRGGWVCFLGSMVLFFLLLFRAKLVSLRTLVVIAMVVIMFAGLGLGFFGLVRSRLVSDDYGAAYSRIPLNKMALAVIKAHPFLGVGVKNYHLVMHLYNPNLEKVPVALVHNGYLLKAAEMGIPGLLIFLWFLSSIFIQGLRNLKTRDIFLISLNIGLLASMAALWAHWLVDPGRMARLAYFWYLVGIVAATGKMCEEKRPMPAESQDTNRFLRRNPGSCGVC